MTLLQLHYTSCEHGLSGHSGFQFCAMSPGVPQAVIREVEQLTAYEPPLALRASGTGDAAEYPVNLIHAYSESNGSEIIAHVVFTGVDFSNRSGNYFAHSLVSDDAQADLGALLPVELWAAPFWQARQEPGTVLPPLPAPPTPGSISAQAIGDLLAGRPDHAAQLGLLLTAVADAMDSGQQVLLVESDTAAVCRWIAAVCYLLGPKLGRQLTFTTYSHDPRRCRTHVVGTVADSASVRVSAGTVFQTFDLAGGLLPELVASPAAALLAGTGVAGSAELWRLAAALGELPDSVDESFPQLASAALLLGRALTEQDLDAAVHWLAAGAHQVSDECKVSAVRALLRQDTDRLPVQRAAELIGLAVSADAAGGAGQDELTTAVECALVNDFFARLDRSGLPRDAHTPYRTAGAREAAAAGCVARLPQANAERAVELLDWALHARLTLPAVAVRDVGRGTVTTAILHGASPSSLGKVAPAWPALRLGILDRLQELPAAAQQAAFASLGWEMFQLDDLEPYPALAEHWFDNLVERRRLRPVAALPRVVELRRRRGFSPAVDEELLTRLWPTAGWTPAEAAEVVKQLPVEELSAEPVRYRLAAILHNPPSGPAGRRVDGLRRPAGRPAAWGGERSPAGYRGAAEARDHANQAGGTVAQAVQPDREPAARAVRRRRPGDVCIPRRASPAVADPLSVTQLCAERLCGEPARTVLPVRPVRARARTGRDRPGRQDLHRDERAPLEPPGGPGPVSGGRRAGTGGARLEPEGDQRGGRRGRYPDEART